MQSPYSKSYRSNETKEIKETNEKMSLIGLVYSKVLANKLLYHNN
jgi:hypothetical protein